MSIDDNLRQEPTTKKYEMEILEASKDNNDQARSYFEQLLSPTSKPYAMLEPGILEAAIIASAKFIKFANPTQQAAFNRRIQEMLNANKTLRTRKGFKNKIIWALCTLPIDKKEALKFSREAFATDFEEILRAQRIKISDEEINTISFFLSLNFFGTLAECIESYIEATEAYSISEEKEMVEYIRNKMNAKEVKEPILSPSYRERVFAIYPELELEKDCYYSLGVLENLISIKNIINNKKTDSKSMRTLVKQTLEVAQKEALFGVDKKCRLFDSLNVAQAISQYREAYNNYSFILQTRFIPQIEQDQFLAELRDDNDYNQMLARGMIPPSKRKDLSEADKTKEDEIFGAIPTPEQLVEIVNNNVASYIIKNCSTYYGDSADVNTYNERTIKATENMSLNDIKDLYKAVKTKIEATSKDKSKQKLEKVQEAFAMAVLEKLLHYHNASKKIDNSIPKFTRENERVARNIELSAIIRNFFKEEPIAERFLNILETKDAVYDDAWEALSSTYHAKENATHEVQKNGLFDLAFYRITHWPEYIDLLGKKELTREEQERLSQIAVGEGHGRRR